jgi:NAD-dependent SIR2 family protein deacetylase
VKPDTVLYGSSLPARFFELITPGVGNAPGAGGAGDTPGVGGAGDLAVLGVLFIAGTSLTVVGLCRLTPG